jgi:hypothetical protein
MPGGGRLTFAYLERDSDADAYQGHSRTRVYIEEVGTFPSSAPIMKLMATLRSGVGVPCGMRLTGNPGGAGHQWVKARYIDPAPLGWRVITEAAFRGAGEGPPPQRRRLKSRWRPRRAPGNAMPGSVATTRWLLHLSLAICLLKHRRPAARSL